MDAAATTSFDGAACFLARFATRQPASWLAVAPRLHTPPPTRLIVVVSSLAAVVVVSPLDCVIGAASDALLATTVCKVGRVV